jgi:hypothetical protein
VEWSGMEWSGVEDLPKRIKIKYSRLCLMGSLWDREKLIIITD